MLKRWKILLIALLILGGFVVAAEVDEFDLIRHFYYMKVFGVDIKFYINGVKIKSLKEEENGEKIDGEDQISGGASTLFKKGSNTITFEFKKRDEGEIDERLKGKYTLKNFRALVRVVSRTYNTEPSYLVNFKFSLDKLENPKVHIWNILDEDSAYNAPHNNDEFVAEQYQKLAREMKVTQLPNGYTRVEATVDTDVSIDPIWMEATPYDNSNEHRRLLEEAYIEYWQILNGGLINKLTGQSLEQFYDAYVSDMARYESNKETVFSMINPNNMVRGLTLRNMLPFENFTVEKSAAGRLLRLVMVQDGEEISPITYGRNGKIAFTLMPYFSIIKGKVILTKG